jgi:hypothetical protein
MPDRLEKLRQTLSALATELREVDSLDAPTRRKLEEVASEMIAALHRSEQGNDTPAPEGSLQDRVTEFEASHPNLAVVFHRLIDILGQMGI